MKEYYDTRAPRVRRLVPRTRRASPTATARAGRASSAELVATIEALPAGRTLDVACGTGFLTRHLRGDVVGARPERAHARRGARGRRRTRRSSRATPSRCRSRTTLRPRVHRALLRPPRPGRARSASSPRRGASRRSSWSSTRRGRTREVDEEMQAARARTTAPTGRSSSAGSPAPVSPPSSAAATCCTRAAGSSSSARRVDAAPYELSLARLAEARPAALPRLRRGRAIRSSRCR